MAWSLLAAVMLLGLSLSCSPFSATPFAACMVLPSTTRMGGMGDIGMELGDISLEVRGVQPSGASKRPAGGFSRSGDLGLDLGTLSLGGRGVEPAGVTKRRAVSARTTVKRQRLLKLELKKLGKLPAASKYARHRIAIVQKALSLCRPHTSRERESSLLTTYWSEST